MSWGHERGGNSYKTLEEVNITDKLLKMNEILHVERKQILHIERK